MKIQQFQDKDADYARWIALHKLLEPEIHLTVEGLRQMDRDAAAEGLQVRFMGEQDENVVAAGTYWHSPRSNPGLYGFSIMVHPDHQQGPAPSLMHDYLLAQLITYHPQTIASTVREDASYHIRLLEKDGFRLTQRNPRSQLDVTTLKIDSYTGLFEQLDRQAIRFVTLTQVMDNDPDWRVNVWRMFSQIEADIPTPWPENPMSYEEYASYYEGEDFRPDSWIIAIDNRLDGPHRYVGMSVVNIMSTRPDALFAGITGVVRSHRRQKIATALKLHTIEYARQAGYRYIKTDNEESNPMYDLNLKLGFQPLPATLYYKRSG
jgi:GNAT superfamily N-acetyltransferase